MLTKVNFLAPHNARVIKVIFAAETGNCNHDSIWTKPVEVIELHMDHSNAWLTKDADAYLCETLAPPS